MPISWRGTLQQYAGRLHRLHANKQMVQIYDEKVGTKNAFLSSIIFRKSKSSYVNRLDVLLPAVDLETKQGMVTIFTAIRSGADVFQESGGEP